MAPSTYSVISFCAVSMWSSPVNTSSSRSGSGFGARRHSRSAAIIDRHVSPIRRISLRAASSAIAGCPETCGTRYAGRHPPCADSDGRTGTISRTNFANAPMKGTSAAVAATLKNVWTQAIANV